MKRRHLILSLGGASAGAMTIGSGAFSSAEAERGVNVSVVEDDSALVGYDNSSDSDGEKSVTDDERVDLVTVENRFANGVKLFVPNLSVIPDSGEYPKIDEGSLEFPEGLGPGDSGMISGTVRCDGHNDRATVEVTVRVEGGGVSAEVFGDTETRRFDVVCAEVTTYSAAGGITVRGVEFNGKGNAEVLSSDDGEVDVRVYYVDGGGVARTDFEPVSVDEKLKKHPSIDNETFAGVEIERIDGVFVHPQFDETECDVTSSSDGNGVSGGEVTETKSLGENPFGEDCFSTEDD